MVSYLKVHRDVMLWHLIMLVCFLNEDYQLFIYGIDVKINGQIKIHENWDSTNFNDSNV